MKKEVYGMEFKYVALFVLLLFPIAAAIGPQGPVGAGGKAMAGLESRWAIARGQMLNGSMDNAVCKAGYMAKAIDAVMENVNGTDGLMNLADKLDNDVAALQNYANDGNILGFRAYMHNTFTPHMAAAKSSINDAWANATLAERLRLSAEFRSLQTEYLACNGPSLGRFGDAKADAYDVALERARARAGALSAKGVDVSGIESLIDEAREQVVDPLNDGLDSADNGTAMRGAIGGYCLMNGCPNGLNFHFWAKFEAEKLDSILASISDDARAAGLSDDVDSAQADIDSARNSIDDIGSGTYSSGIGKEVMDSLREASRKITAIYHNLRSG